METLEDEQNPTFGRTESDTLNEFRAVYDILHDSTYIRVVIFKDNWSGKPSASFYILPPGRMMFTFIAS